MRLLFVHSGADLYGASRSLLRLTSRLVRDGHSVLVLLPYDGPLHLALREQQVQVLLHPQMPVITRARCRTIAGIFGLLLSIPISVWQLWRIARRFQPAVIHTNTALILSPGVVALLVGVPHVWHVREFFSEFRLLFPLYQWYMYAFARVIICVSRAVAEQFAPGIRQRRIVVLHNGFPRAEFDGLSQSRVDAFRRRYQLDGHTLVGVAGRIKLGRKGQDLFIKAGAMIKDQFPEVKLLCIGSPFPGNEPQLDELRALVRDAGLEKQFVYTGDVEDIRDAYAALDIAVLPSAMPEPFGGVVIESMAMGKPVIGTRLGGTSEQIEDGVTGFLVDAHDPRPLAQALARLLADPAARRRMGEQGRTRFLQQFEFEPFYQRLLSLYFSLQSGQTAVP